MSNKNSSNKAAVPEAKSALNRFKYEVANELGVPLSDGYNGDLTSRQNGSVGGYMVNLMLPEQPNISVIYSPVFKTKCNLAFRGPMGCTVILSIIFCMITASISFGVTPLKESSSVLMFSNWYSIVSTSGFSFL